MAMILKMILIEIVIKYSKKKKKTQQKQYKKLSATGKMKKHQENEEVGLSFSEDRMEINTASLSPK